MKSMKLSLILSMVLFSASFAHATSPVPPNPIEEDFAYDCVLRISQQDGSKYGVATKQFSFTKKDVQDSFWQGTSIETDARGWKHESGDRPTALAGHSVYLSAMNRALANGQSEDRLGASVTLRQEIDGVRVTSTGDGQATRKDQGFSAKAGLTLSRTNSDQYRVMYMELNCKKVR